MIFTLKYDIEAVDKLIKKHLQFVNLDEDRIVKFNTNPPSYVDETQFLDSLFNFILTLVASPKKGTINTIIGNEIVLKKTLLLSYTLSQTIRYLDNHAKDTNYIGSFSYINIFKSDMIKEDQRFLFLFNYQDKYKDGEDLNPYIIKFIP